MPSRRRRIACLLASATLAMPGAAWGQSAGDEQYEDPFAPEPGQTDEGGSTGGGGSTSGGGTTPAPAAPEPAAAPPPAQTAATTDQLPRTGADIGLVALGGMLLLASGVVLRVRLGERARRR